MCLSTHRVYVACALYQIGLNRMLSISTKNYPTSSWIRGNNAGMYINDFLSLSMRCVLPFEPLLSGMRHVLYLVFSSLFFQGSYIVIISKLFSRVLCEILPYLLYDVCALEGIFLLCICWNQNSKLWYQKVLKTEFRRGYWWECITIPFWYGVKRDNAKPWSYLYQR